MANGGICLFGGRKVLLPDAHPKGLVGHWTFDQVKPIDTSGNYNHGKNSIPPGPGVGARGASALFNGFDYVEVPHSPSFAAQEFAVTFWAFLSHAPVAHGADRLCPLLHKGKVNNDHAPSLLLNTRTRALKFVVSTDSDEHPSGEFVESNARMPVQRWTHFALVRKAHGLQLYVNGILDAEKTPTAATVLNEGPLYIGAVPWLRDTCNLNVLIDEVRFYSRTLDHDEVQAEAAPALGGIEPGFMHFGCSDCTVEKAAESCRDGYHLCTAMELHTGGYQVARTMGFVDWTSHVWTHAALKEEANKEALGVGLCCTDQR